MFSYFIKNKIVSKYSYQFSKWFFFSVKTKQSIKIITSRKRQNINGLSIDASNGCYYILPLCLSVNKNIVWGKWTL